MNGGVLAVEPLRVLPIPPVGSNAPPVVLKDIGYWKRKQINLCSWMIKYVGKHSPELLINFIMEKASEVAVSVTMAILDRERIGHCFRCPQRFGLRKSSDGKYVCLNHQEKRG